MCYSTHQGKPKSELEKHFDAVAKLPEYLDDDDLRRFHINGFAKQSLNGGKAESPHPIMLVLPQENPKFMAPLMWGLIPHWESGEDAAEYYKKTIKYGSGLNATTEKLFSSQMYKDNAMHRRCVVPVTGFFEPHTTETKVKGKPFKVPFFFERMDKEIIKLAGIYAFTNDGHATFAILTKPATPLFEKIHNTKKRRPVILNDGDLEGWLDNTAQRNDIEHIIHGDMADEEIRAYPISKDLYSRTVDSNRPDITDHVFYEEVEIDYSGKPEAPLDLFS